MKGTNFIVEIEETASAATENTDYLNSREDVSSTVTMNVTNMVTQGKNIIICNTQANQKYATTYFLVHVVQIWISSFQNNCQHILAYYRIFQIFIINKSKC